MNIVSPDSTFDFSTITLSSPPSKQADGTFFTKLLNSGGPLYVQTPVGGTKNGIVKFSRHKHVDLVFESNLNNDFIAWGEKLEERCCTLIYEKAVEWFNSDIEPQDVDNINFFKSYKSGMYQTISTSIKKLSDNSDELIIYDETNTMKSSDDVKRESSIISIIEICGIHFSAKNFKVLIQLKQLMLLEPPPAIDETTPIESPESPFSTCLIQPHTEECSELNLSDSNVEHVLEHNHENKPINEQADDFEIEKINLEPDEQLVETELEFIDLDELSKPSTRETHGDDELKTIKNTSLNAKANTLNTVNNNDVNIEPQLKLDSSLANLDDLGAVSLDVNVTPQFDNSNIKSVKTSPHHSRTNFKIEPITQPEALDRRMIEDDEDEHKIINNPSLINDPLTLKPRDEIINEMYSSAKDEMDRLKHEFIAATIKFENLKKEYRLN